MPEDTTNLWTALKDVVKGVLSGFPEEFEAEYREKALKRQEDAPFWQKVLTEGGVDSFLPVVGMFKGIKGATSYEKHLHGIAKGLEKSGKGAESIRQKTGWFRGPYDKMWRREMDVSDMELSENFPLAELSRLAKEGKGEGLVGTLQNAIKSKELFESYPHLKDVAVDLTPAIHSKEPFVHGSFDHHKQLMNMETPLIEEATTFRLPATQIQEAIAHEATHGIQWLENFAKGGNKGMFEGFNHPNRPAIAQYKDRLSNQIQALGYDKKGLPLHGALTKEELATDNKLWALRKLEEKLMGSSSYTRYRSMAGEIEADEAAKRLRYTAKDREELKPFFHALQEFPPEEAITQFDYGYRTSRNVDLDEMFKRLSTARKESDELLENFEKVLREGTPSGSSGIPQGSVKVKEPTATHGTFLDKLDDILSGGLKKGSALDFTKDKSWASEYEVFVDVPTARKGEFVEHNKFYKSSAPAKPTKVTVDLEAFTDEGADAALRQIEELKRKHPGVKWKIKGEGPSSDAVTRSNVAKLYEKEYGLSPEEALETATFDFEVNTRSLYRQDTGKRVRTMEEYKEMLKYWEDYSD